jgi:thioredoxin 1
MKVINEKEFESATKEGLVLVDFFASWCGPCRMMAVILEDVQKELEGKVEIYKVDVDNDEKLARSFGIMSIPTLILFENGKEVEKHIGLWQKEDLIDTINSYLK